MRKTLRQCIILYQKLLAKFLICKLSEDCRYIKKLVSKHYVYRRYNISRKSILIKRKYKILFSLYPILYLCNTCSFFSIELMSLMRSLPSHFLYLSLIISTLSLYLLEELQRNHIFYEKI